MIKVELSSSDSVDTTTQKCLIPVMKKDIISVTKDEDPHALFVKPTAREYYMYAQNTYKYREAATMFGDPDAWSMCNSQFSVSFRHRKIDHYPWTIMSTTNSSDHIIFPDILPDQDYLVSMLTVFSTSVFNPKIVDMFMGLSR